MALSTKALNILADTLAPKIAEQIMQSESFIEYLHEVIPALVDTEVGEMDCDLHFDLSMMVLERLSLVAVKYN
jgi:hypothetical protein